eukprot:gb/GECG01015324.1/.p1 GENE.gb/GECG01015324.1/~~gb/GECG01015324.1/.p1  ORF type:complete len:160 (+),score=7.98 gb/GECG01015324.1/:1-480(+)
MENILKGVFYCEFDNKQGPVLHFQYPQEFVSSSDFDAISPYLITKPGLCGSVMSIKRRDFTVLGYPVRIDSSHYDRNVFLFSVGFYIDSVSDQEPYAQVLRKLGQFLDDAERKLHFISSLGESHYRHNVHALLRRVHVGLVQSGECVVPAIAGTPATRR